MTLLPIIANLVSAYYTCAHITLVFKDEQFSASSDGDSTYHTSNVGERSVWNDLTWHNIRMAVFSLTDVATNRSYTDNIHIIW